MLDYIFLFLSGIGLYYSISKNSVEVFYKRRLKRLLPSYLPFIIGWFAMRTFIAVKVSYVPIDVSVSGILTFIITFMGNLTMTGWFLGLESQFNWYVLMAAGICILYASRTYWVQYAYGYGLYWYPFILITPGLCILLAKGFETIGTGKIRNKLLAAVRTIGDASFEIYLIHIALFSFFFNIQGLDAHMLWFIWMPVAVIAGIIYKKMIDFCRLRICAKREGIVKKGRKE